MRKDTCCIICGKLIPNAHHLTKYCGEKCLITVRKQQNRMKTEIRRRRNAEFEALPETEKSEIMMDARRDIMESLDNGTPLYKFKGK